MTSVQRRWSPAIIFLSVIAAVIIAVFVFLAWASADPARTLRMAFVPSHSFDSETPAAPYDYGDLASWHAHPRLTPMPDWQDGLATGDLAPGTDIFFVHPTTLLDRRYWTDPLDNPATKSRTLNLTLKGQANAFAPYGKLYAPRYRQASFGAFLDQSGDGVRALRLAYSDIVRAFDAFLAQRNSKHPFILAGHSQGALHLLYLLRDRVAAKGLQGQMIAAYIIGWPVSLETDLEALDNIDACEQSDSYGCVLSWQSFGKDGDPAFVQAGFDATAGLNGAPRKGSTILCVNPLTGTRGGFATAGDHAGARYVLTPKTPPGTPATTSGSANGAALVEFSGARCDRDGFLYLDRTPGDGWRDYVLAGENYHPYDIHLFFNNIGLDIGIRRIAWLEAQP